MKKIAIIIMLLLAMGVSYAQAPKGAKVIKAEKVSKKSSKSTYTPTGVWYQDSKGNQYELYAHKITKGANAGKTAYYIRRTSKTSGKEYWQKIDSVETSMINK